jgi:hypothetical protein
MYVPKKDEGRYSYHGQEFLIFRYKTNEYEEWWWAPDKDLPAWGPYPNWYAAYNSARRHLKSD